MQTTTDVPPPRIGHAVRVLRELAGLSRAALARASEIHPNTLLRLELGATQVGVDTLQRVVDALNTTIPVVVSLIPFLDDDGHLPVGNLIAWVDSLPSRPPASLLGLRADPAPLPTASKTPAAQLVCDLMRDATEPLQLDILQFALEARKRQSAGLEA